jgi:hypothetical protein
MKTDPRPTLNEVTAWLETQPEIAYSHPWSFVVAALIVSIIVTIVGYTAVRVWKRLTK